MDACEIQRDEWYTRAKKTTMNDLSAFLEELSDAQPGFNTSPCAVAAAAIATAWAVNLKQNLTGFQANFVMCEFIEHWCGIEPPYRLVKYNLMLYPQFNVDFDKTFSEDTWIWLKQEAQKGLDKWVAGDNRASPQVINHWLKIVSGEKPFGYKTTEEYKNKPYSPPIRTQKDVLQAWREDRLVLR